MLLVFDEGNLDCAAEKGHLVPEVAPLIQRGESVWHAQLHGKYDNENEALRIAVWRSQP